MDWNKITILGQSEHQKITIFRAPLLRNCPKSRRTQNTRMKMHFFCFGNSVCASKGAKARKGDTSDMPSVQPTEPHASTSILRTSAGVLCLGSNGDWWWKKIFKLGSFGWGSELAWAGKLGLESYSYWSTDAMILKWEHNKWYTWWGPASSRWADWPAVIAPSPS